MCLSGQAPHGTDAPRILMYGVWASNYESCISSTALSLFSSPFLGQWVCSMPSGLKLLLFSLYAARCYIVCLFSWFDINPFQTDTCVSGTYRCLDYRKSFNLNAFKFILLNYIKEVGCGCVTGLRRSTKLLPIRPG